MPTNEELERQRLANEEMQRQAQAAADAAFASDAAKAQVNAYAQIELSKDDGYTAIPKTFETKNALSEQDKKTLEILDSSISLSNDGKSIKLDATKWQFTGEKQPTAEEKNDIDTRLENAFKSYKKEFVDDSKLEYTLNERDEIVRKDGEKLEAKDFQKLSDHFNENFQKHAEKAFEDSKFEVKDAKFSADLFEKIQNAQTLQAGITAPTPAPASNPEPRVATQYMSLNNDNTYNSGGTAAATPTSYDSVQEQDVGYNALPASSDQVPMSAGYTPNPMTHSPISAQDTNSSTPLEQGVYEALSLTERAAVDQTSETQESNLSQAADTYSVLPKNNATEGAFKPTRPVPTPPIATTQMALQLAQTAVSSLHESVINKTANFAREDSHASSTVSIGMQQPNYQAAAQASSNIHKPAPVQQQTNDTTPTLGQ